MILDSLNNSARYASIHPLFKQAFEYINNTDFTHAEAGKFILIPDKLFVIVADIIGKERVEALLETHQRFIDIQLPVIGSETIGWNAIDQLKHVSVPYNEIDDITFYSDSPTIETTLNPGQFVIYFPEDAHAPGIGSGAIRKVIVKISANSL